MEEPFQLDLAAIARGLKLQLAQVQAVVDLLDDGNTVPFITRYRKDQTGGLDEVQIRAVQQAVTGARQLSERKAAIVRSIEAQGKLTPELRRAIVETSNPRKLEDLYLPYRPKKQTLATTAHERGLSPLAAEILAGSVSAEGLDARAGEFVDPDRQLTSIADVLLGVGHILAEQFSERADVRARLREIFRSTGELTSRKAGSDEKQAKQFADYFDFRQPASKVPPHRVLAINRGERSKQLRVKIAADTDAMQNAAAEMLVPEQHPHADFLRGCAKDALARLVVPSLERELRRELTETAEDHAVRVFARNLRNLLLQPPVTDKRILAIDPGFRSGCKLAVIDGYGQLLDHAVIHIVGKDERVLAGKEKLVELARQHQVDVIVIGNGTACRETEQIVSDLLADQLKSETEAGLAYVIVNEAGASVYSTSQIGREEFPDYDATLRGAISIGRRLQDPLSELVKIDAANIGVGLYQHDVKAKHLSSSLDEVVHSCVNYVGVDLNTASAALLRYVSGLNQLTARRLYEYRSQKGPFKSRDQLKNVPGLGDATFVQAAGFLKIPDSDNLLDATWIHPESYEVAEKVLTHFDGSLSDLRRPTPAGAGAAEPSGENEASVDNHSTNSQAVATKQSTPQNELTNRLAAANRVELSERIGVGRLLLEDIVTQLSRPGRDPREGLPRPVFRHGIIKMEDLSDGMELTGTVLNVVDFGVFVDIGLHESGLVHVSQLTSRFVRDPHEVVAVGDIVKVWVTSVDKERRRIALTMIAPGSEKPPAQRQKPTRRKKPQKKHDKPASRGPKKRSRPPRKPSRPVVPITDEMVKGSEPMRTFGDLKQLMERRGDDEPDEKS